jgi:hypothetical protein
MHPLYMPLYTCLLCATAHPLPTNRCKQYMRGSQMDKMQGLKSVCLPAWYIFEFWEVKLACSCEAGHFTQGEVALARWQYGWSDGSTSRLGACTKLRLYTRVSSMKETHRRIHCGEAVALTRHMLKSAGVAGNRVAGCACIDRVTLRWPMERGGEGRGGGWSSQSPPNASPGFVWGVGSCRLQSGHKAWQRFPPLAGMQQKPGKLVADSQARKLSRPRERGEGLSKIYFGPDKIERIQVNR